MFINMFIKYVITTIANDKGMRMANTQQIQAHNNKKK